MTEKTHGENELYTDGIFIDGGYKSSTASNLLFTQDLENRNDSLLGINISSSGNLTPKTPKKNLNQSAFENVLKKLSEAASLSKITSLRGNSTSSSSKSTPSIRNSTSSPSSKGTSSIVNSTLTAAIIALSQTPISKNFLKKVPEASSSKSTSLKGNSTSSPSNGTSSLVNSTLTAPIINLSQIPINIVVAKNDNQDLKEGNIILDLDNPESEKAYALMAYFHNEGHGHEISEKGKTGHISI